MVRSLSKMQLHILFQCLSSLKDVNIFQLFPKAKNTNNSFESFNNAKQRVITIANMAIRAYIPIQRQMTFFTAKDLSFVLNGFYMRFGIFESNGKLTQIHTEPRAANSWPSITQFLHYLINFRDGAKYIADSPIPSIRKEYKGRISVHTLDQLIEIFGIINLHYSNPYTKVGTTDAKEILFSVFGYF